MYRADYDCTERVEKYYKNLSTARRAHWHEFGTWPGYFDLRLTEIQTLLDFCIFPEGGTWLEIGAGIGLLSWILAPLSDRMIASDLYDQVDKRTHTPGLQRARGFPDAIGDKQIELIQASATDLSTIPDHSIRVLLNAWLLEHIPNREKAIREFRRVLEPGGICVSVVPTFMEKVSQPAAATIRLCQELIRLLIRLALIPILRPNTFRRLSQRDDQKSLSLVLYIKRLWTSNIISISGHFRPHGEYRNAFDEFRANLPYVWINKLEEEGLEITDFFCPMLFPFHLFYGLSFGVSARLARISFPLWRPLCRAPEIRWLGTGIVICATLAYEIISLSIQLVSSQIILRLIDRCSALIPWLRQGNLRKIFIDDRPGQGGPGIFIGKLVHEMQHLRVAITYRELRSSQGALIISGSWGDWFHHLCKHWNVRTVLRVDGFYLPTYFDNRSQPPGLQDRRLTPEMMKINYRLQYDLLQADFVIYQSAFSKEMCDHFLYNRRDNFSIIFNGVDLDHFRPGPPRSGRRRLLVFGTIRDEYMLGTALPVFKHLWREYDLELLIIGPLDTFNQQLLESFQQRRHAPAERIRWLGQVANGELPRLLQEADILLHPRLGDSCPNTVVEAMACGLPVVCGSWGGAAELVGTGGLVTPTGPWGYGEAFVLGMADRTAKILDNLEHFWDAARAQAEAKFDIRWVARSYLDALGISKSDY